MAARATGSAPRRLAAAVAGGIALAASAQSYLPDLRPPPPRVATAPPAGEPCNACGRIVSIREVYTERSQDTPAARNPAFASSDVGNSAQNQNLIGAVIYLPLGGQSADKPYIGGVGTPELQSRFRETTYEVTVRLDDGSYRFVRRGDASLYGVGDRVRLVGSNELELLVD